MSQLTEFISGVGVVLGVIAAATVLLVKTWNTAKRIDQAIGVDLQGKTMAQRQAEHTNQLSDQSDMLKQMDSRLTAVEGVLSPPGQESLPFRVRRVEEDVSEVRKEIGQVVAKVDTLTVLVKRDIEGH